MRPPLSAGMTISSFLQNQRAESKKQLFSFRSCVQWVAKWLSLSNPSTNHKIPKPSLCLAIHCISQFHNHAQYVNVEYSGGPLENQTWQTEWKTSPLDKVQLCEYENQTSEAFGAVALQNFPLLATAHDCETGLLLSFLYSVYYVHKSSH